MASVWWWRDQATFRAFWKWVEWLDPDAGRETRRLQTTQRPRLRGHPAHGFQILVERDGPLAEWFIRSFCPPGGTVLDPFVGSGTTAAVALMHGRNAIGIDVRQDQIDLARRRIASQVAFTDGSSP